MPSRFPCELVTWGRFYALCRRLAEGIRRSGYRPEAMVAIGRGGWMPGRVPAVVLDQMSLTSFKVEHYRGAHRESLARVRYPLAADVSGLRVLLVDDVSDSGDTFRVALDHLRARSQPAEVRTAVLHHKVVSAFEPDLYAARVVKWRWIIYPWAVIEDLTGLVRTMDPPPSTLESMASALAERHGLRVPRRTLEDVRRALGEA